MEIRITSLLDNHESGMYENYYSTRNLESYKIPGLIKKQTDSFLVETDWNDDGEPIAYESKPIYSYFIDFTSPEQLFEITKLTKHRLIFTSYDGENGSITIYDDWME